MKLTKIFAIAAIVAASIGLGACAKKQTSPVTTTGGAATYGYSK